MLNVSIYLNKFQIYIIITFLNDYDGRRVPVVIYSRQYIRLENLNGILIFK